MTKDIILADKQSSDIIRQDHLLFESMQTAIRDLQKQRDELKPKADSIKEKEGLYTKLLEYTYETIADSANWLLTGQWYSGNFGNPHKHILSYGPFAMQSGLNKVDSLENAAKKFEQASKTGNKNERETAYQSFKQFYNEITGTEWLGQKNSENKLAKLAIEQYKETGDKHFDFATMLISAWAGKYGRLGASQYVDKIANPTASIGLPFLTAGLAGAIAKPTLSWIDKRLELKDNWLYSTDNNNFNFGREVLTGALWGALWPAYELIGSGTSKLIMNSAQKPVSELSKLSPPDQLARLTKSDVPLTLIQQDKFVSYIKAAELDGSAIAGLSKTQQFKLHQVADHATWTPGWIAYDFIGYPGQMFINNSTHHGKEHSYQELALSPLSALQVGLIGGALGAPLYRYMGEPVLRRFVETPINKTLDILKRTGSKKAH